MKINFRHMAALGAFALFNGPLAISETGDAADERHIINVDRVELSSLVDDVSIITGYTFVLHPDVGNTKVTIRSQTPVTSSEVFQIFLSTLRVHGFAAIPSGRGVYRVLPEKEAVGAAATSAAGRNSFVTEVIRLDRFDAIEAAQMVKPLIDPQGQVVANSGSNTLVLVDYASNMSRLREVISQMDGADRVRVETINLEHIPAREVEAMLLNLLGKQGGEGGRSQFEVSASTSTNAIVVRGENDVVDKAVNIARELDHPKNTEETLRIIPLKHASAEEIIPILEALGGSLSTSPGGDTPLSASATIAHHQPTNTLVISAPQEMLLSMERVVDELDQRRAQVLVEAIIVEMSDDTARDLGLQFLLSGTGDSTVPFLSTNFSRSAPNLLSLTGALADPSGVGSTLIQPALTSLLGLEGATFGAGGSEGNTLFGAVLTAVEQDTRSKVLSKPFNLTLDNAESELTVGQEVPVPTGSTLSDTNDNPFTTVERVDVGITLRVKPRISADDTIQLEIFQEVSSVLPVTSVDGPVFNTRNISTTVLADNGEVIVIGGLIEESDGLSNSKVPLLGDIPVLGNAFKSEGRARARTNLMVFIKPTIVRDRDDARSVTDRNYDLIIAEEFLREDADDRGGIDQFFNSTLGQVPDELTPQPDVRY